jgi:hypothetical protein
MRPASERPTLETIPEKKVWPPEKFKFKNIFKNIFSKNIFSKNTFSKLSKLRFWRRISGTTGGVMTEG